MPPINTKQPPHAKLTPPRLPPVLKRSRLLTQLDEARKRQIVWLMGPAGIGKTTLVANYIQHRQLSCLWYQLNEEDSDAGSFFHYLSLAVQTAAPRYRKPLPHFTAEYRTSLLTFARRFFEELYRRLKLPSTLVFDNFQTVSPASQLHDVLQILMEEAPEGLTCFFISRDLPPPSFAPMQAKQNLSIVDPDALRLSANEVEQLVKMHSQQNGWLPSDQLVQRMWTETSGWAAGLILLLESARTRESTIESWRADRHTVVFDYLAREVMKDLPQETREFLLKTSFLPTMTTSMAQELTGIADSAHLLSRLYQRRYFTERRFQAQVTYQYHPLFREFLISQALQHFSSSELRELRQKSGYLLEASGEIELAVELYKAAEDQVNLVRLVLSQAPVLTAQGRAETLEGWLKSIASPIYEKTPWLFIWLGVCACRRDHEEGQRLMRRAFDAFECEREEVGMLSAACGIVESIMATWVNIHQLETWLAGLRRIVSSGFVFSSPDLEARVTFALFMAQLWQRPEEHVIRPQAEHVELLLQKELDPAQAMLLGFYLAVYKSWMADYEGMERVLIRLEQIRVRTPLSPLAEIWFRATETAYSFSLGEAEKCIKGVQHGQKVAQHYGLTGMAGALWMNGALGSVSAGELVLAEKYLAETRGLPDQIGLYHHISGWIAALRGDLYEAWKHIQNALSFAQKTGALFPEALNRISAAQVLHEQDKHAEAIEHLNRAKQISEETNSAELICRCDLLCAQFAFDEGNETIGLQFLTRGMKLARSKGVVNWIWWRPSVMARLCMRALEAGIENEFVKHLIKKRKLQLEPSDWECDGWPWAVKIHTLGKFGILINGHAVMFSRKVQRRPFDLLKALIALGGKEVSENTLTDALWPDSDGDAGKRAFTVTLHRLRKLVGPQSIELKGGRVSLCSANACFVDVWAFEELLDKAERAAQSGQSETSRLCRERALSLYSGCFLIDDLAPWSEALRHRLRRKFIQAVVQQSQALEAMGQHEKSIECLRKGMEVDPGVVGELRSAENAMRNRVLA